MSAFRTTTLLTASLLALVAAAPAFAADAPAASAADDQDTRLGEVVITAQKRAQDPVEVPVAVTAYSGKFLEAIGVKAFDELSAFTPGFLVQNQSNNNSGFVMRGITSDSGSATDETRVSIYQDGVPISRSRGSYVELFDMERVEVAKGPQSTLFGRGALIGAVNLVQNKANPAKNDWLLRAEGGTGGYFVGEGMVNFAFGDGSALRIAARARQNDGYVDDAAGGDAYNSTNTKAVRMAYHLEPGPLTLDLIGNYQEDSTSGTSFKSHTFNPTNPVTGQALGDTGVSSAATLAPGAGFEGGAPLGLERKVYGVTALAEYKISDSLTLSSITASRAFHSVEVFDPDGSSLPILTFAEDAQGRQQSQELRLRYDAGGRFSGFVGANYFHETGSWRIPGQYDERLVLALLAGNTPLGISRPNPQPQAVLTNPAYLAQVLQLGFGIPSSIAPGIVSNLKPIHREEFANYGENTAYDVYADGTFKLTDKLEITAGIRYTSEDRWAAYRSNVQNGRSILGILLAAPTATNLFLAAQPNAVNNPLLPTVGLIAQPTANNGDTFSKSIDDNGLTWRLVGRYAPADNLSLYASYARGRRPDVISSSAPSTPLGAARFNVVDSEVVDSYEAGAKGKILDGRLYLSGAVFRYDYDNFATSFRQGAQVVTLNAGKAKAYGFEGEARLQAGDYWTLFGTYAYNHARLESGLREGNRFRLSPDQTFSVGAAFSREALGGKVTFTPTYTWRSKMFFDDDNDRSDLQSSGLFPDTKVDEFQKAYGLLNVRVGFGAVDDRWKVEAFVENLGDVSYLKDAGNTGDSFGIPTFIAGKPRFMGVGVTFRH
ncbi:TonB-dependent receptor [Caulobacter segnis]|uniref:TonB-dependent receptor n=1 Tax=Caulobacter segnis TaxID=88688 RepID=UPI002864C192|nr:TonB-dependent receptor [Caulobacter segnis]MDR6627368.1 outer membrane receptor protein involved in Fe transport [Caulobacter segnis]